MTDAPNDNAASDTKASLRARILGRSLTVMLAVLGLCVLAASGAWMFGAAGWRIDLIANLTAQLLLVTLLMLALTLALRRWVVGVVLIVALAVQLAGLTQGRAPGSAPVAGEQVRMLTMNVFNRGAGRAEVVAMLDGMDVDVMTIVEPNPEVVTLLRSDAFRERYPHSVPQRPWAAKPAVISRWPLEPIVLHYTQAESGDGNPGMSPSIAVVQRPGGHFILIATHPASPRSQQAWEDGNEAVKQLGAMIRDELAPMGLPIVLGGDFNSTPTGARSRSLRDVAGMRRAKPLLALDGTWPGNLPWPARLAIDDALVSDGITVSDWHTFAPVQGGDHSLVRIDLNIPNVIPPAD